MKPDDVVVDRVGLTVESVQVKRPLSRFWTTVFWFGNIYMLCVRYWIEYIAVPFGRYYNWTHLASDGQRCNQGVHIERCVRYGKLPGEEMDVLSPTDEYSLPGSIPVLYVHGGGFVCVHRGVMNHSVTPLVRAGFTVYSVDYPLSPEFKYPIPVISVLRALNFLKTECNIDRVKIVADSAGGTLASKAVAVIHNPLHNWHPDLKKALCEFNFPIIEQVALLYTIFDIDSWKFSDSLSLYGLFQNAILSYCMHQHCDTNIDKITLMENYEKINSFPPTFLLCGHSDPLRASHQVFAQHLKQIGVPVQSLLMNGFHGFHGLPAPFSFGLWRSTVFPANVELIKWLTNNEHPSRIPSIPIDRIKGEFDVSLLVVIGITHAFAIYVLSAIVALIIDIL